MVSVVAVASHAGVSPATVSRVLAGRVPVNAETRTRVLEAVEALGYRPNEVARSLRVGRGRAVALVTGDIEQGINAALARHVQSELEALGLDLLLFNMGHREERLHHFLERAPSLGLRGVLLTSPHVMDMPKLLPVIERTAKSGVDILSLGQDLSEFGIASVVHDNEGGARQAVAHLAGSRRIPIAFVGRIESSAIGRARFDGYRAGLHAAGQAVDDALVWDIRQGYRADAGYQAMSDALAKGLRVSAVLGASDELTLGAMAAAHDRGFAVPRDIAFVGFGGLAWGGFQRPSMTTVILDAEGAARAIGEIFGQMRDSQGNPPAGKRLIPTKLVLRQSA